MIGPQTPRDAIRRARESYKGLDKAGAIRVSLALSFAMIAVTGFAVGLATVDDDGFEDDYEDENLDEYDLDETGGSISIDNSTHFLGNASLKVTSDVDSNNPSATLNESIRFDKNESFTVNVSMRRSASQNNGWTENEHRGLVVFTFPNNTRLRMGYEVDSNQNMKTSIYGELVDDIRSSGTSLERNEWMNYSFVIDFQSETVTALDRDNDDAELVVADISGTLEEGNADLELVDANPTGVTVVGDSGTTNFDNLDINGGGPATNPVSGFVKDVDGDPIEDAVVSVNNSSAMDITDSDGFYEVDLADGTHEITARKTNFKQNSITVSVSDGESKENQNITLFSDRELQIETDTHLCHDETTDYAIFVIVGDGPGADRNDVTDNATLTSSDEDVLEVNETSHELIAVSNISINQVVTLTATHDNATETKEVLVGNKSVENVDKFENGLEAMVGLWGNTACRDGADPPGGTQLTMLWIFASLSAAIVVTRFSTTFGGIGAFAVVMTMGWFIGGVGEGMIMLTWAFGIFLGLNVATNFQSFKR